MTLHLLHGMGQGHSARFRSKDPDGGSGETLKLETFSFDSQVIWGRIHRRNPGRGFVGRSLPEDEAVCRYRLYILTAEIIKIC